MPKYLVTGGGGFIGSHIVEALSKKGQGVRVFDNFSTGKRENLTHIKDIEIVQADLADFASIQQALRGIEVIYHQAALPSVARSLQDPRASHDSNVLGTLNLLMAAQKAKCQRVLFAGSSSVYGDQPGFPRQENMPMEPMSPYAASKAAGENFCKAFSAGYGLETVILRYFNVFGPRQDASSEYSGVIARFIQDFVEDKIPTIYGDGKQSRDFTYIDNVVHANLLAENADIPPGEVINVAMQDEISVLQLFQATAKLFNKKVTPKFAAPRAGDVRRSFAAIEKAKRLLGYAPRVDFQQGLANTVAWYRRGKA